MKNPDGSWEKFDDHVLDFALDRMRDQEEVALVTLFNIEGASPRPRGAQMAVTRSGDWVGYLSGGCVERAVVSEAQAALREGRSRCVRYGRGSQYMDIQLPCGSAIDLHFEVELAESQLAEIEARLANRKPASLRIGDRGLSPAFPLLRHYLPRRRLIVAGTGPAAVQLARLARSSGFETVLRSPDEATRAAASGHGVETIAQPPAADPADFGADPWTAIVFMFHDHDWEMDLLPAALGTDAFYIGAMGSRRTHAQRLEMLAAIGIDEAARSRIRGPAGLFAGAKSASDIALSILGEIAANEAAAPLLESPMIVSDDPGARESARNAMLTIS